MFYVIDSQRIAVGHVLRSVLIRTSFGAPKFVRCRGHRLTGLLPTLIGRRRIGGRLWTATSSRLRQHPKTCRSPIQDSAQCAPRTWRLEAAAGFAPA